MSTTKRSLKDQGLNTCLVLIDGDNVRGTFGLWNRWPPLDALIDWIADPDNLGVEKIIRTVYFGTVRDVNNPSEKEVPFRYLDATTLEARKISLELRLYEDIPTKGVTRAFWHKYISRGSKKMGIPDETIMARAFGPEFKDYKTLILVTSDNDFFSFAAEVRQGINRFRLDALPLTREEQEKTSREVVIIGSDKSGRYDWTEQAQNYAKLEDILPKLDSPVPPEEPAAPASTIPIVTQD